MELNFPGPERGWDSEDLECAPPTPRLGPRQHQWVTPPCRSALGAGAGLTILSVPTAIFPASGLAGPLCLATEGFHSRKEGSSPTPQPGPTVQLQPLPHPPHPRPRVPTLPAPLLMPFALHKTLTYLPYARPPAWTHCLTAFLQVKGEGSHQTQRPQQGLSYSVQVSQLFHTSLLIVK